MNKRILVLGVLLVVLIGTGAIAAKVFLSKRSAVKASLVGKVLVTEVDVVPEQVALGVSFVDLIPKMIKGGAIDKSKFLKLYEGRDVDVSEINRLLNGPSYTEIVVNKENSGLILNLLWPLGIANKTQVLSGGPMGTTYKKDAGDFASTGGWTLGTKPGGTLFNSLSLLPLNSDQEETVKEISSKVYRPCCGNNTYFPDCNHGAAMLAYIEMAVAAGRPKEEIYRNALALNSYWFTQTYVEIATYLKAKENLDWKDVDPVKVLGINYSSGQGAAKVSKELRAIGLLPEVQGGSGCGI